MIEKMTWNEAKEYAEKLTVGVHSDWHVPTLDELKTLFDYEKRKPVVEMLPSSYWSSSTYAYLPGSAWVVDFGYGYVYGSNKYYSYYVRCVRGGQFDHSGNLIIPGLAVGQDRITVNFDGSLTDNRTGLVWEAE